MICKKSWMLQSKSGGIDFLDVSLKNNSTICSSSSAPYYIARCHLGTDIWIHLCLTQFVELTQFDKTMWITHPYHPSKSSKKCQKYVQKNMGMYFNVFPISIFLHEIVFLHGKFIAVSQASTLDQYLADED